MLSLTAQERKVLIAIGLIILVGAALKFFNVSFKEPIVAQEVNQPSIININAASQIELESLPGIGPVMAWRIIDYRSQSGEFRTLDDLKEVKGIGDKKAQAIGPYITFENKYQ